MNFEEKLERLEKITEIMKQENSSLDNTIKSFEEGITLATELENELNSYEKKVQILLVENDKNHFEDFK